MFRKIQILAWRAKQSRAFSVAALIHLLAANALFFFVTPLIWADDCSSDWRRAEDCLRTPGFAQGLGTTAGVVGTILINGMAVSTLVLKPRGTGGKDGENPPDKQYYLDVRTEASRTTLMADGKETMWIYAKVTCSDPTVNCASITSGIGFSPGGANADWIKALQQDLGDYKSMQICAAPSNPAQMGQTGQATMDITAVCEGGYLTASVPLQLGSLTGEWDLTTEPKDCSEIMPDSKQGVWLYARVKFDESKVPPDQLAEMKADIKKNMKFKKDGSGWIDCSPEEGQEVGEYMATWITAANPSGNVGAIQGPESGSVTISTQFLGQALQTVWTIKLTARPEIDAKPDCVQLLMGSKQNVDVTVWVNNAGPNAWSFDPRYNQGEKDYASYTVTPEGPARAKVTITEAAEGISPDSPWTSTNLSVFAKDEKTELELERIIKILICQEGLSVEGMDDDGTIHVRADGKQQKTKIQFRVFVYDAATKQLTADANAASKLKIDILDEAKTPPYNCASYCVVHHEFDHIVQSNTPSAMYNFWAEKELPGEDRILVRYQVSVEGKDPEKFSKVIPVTLEVMTEEEESDAKEVEISRCREVIRKYIPADKQQKFYELVDRRKDTLGPKGLATLRKKIWGIAVQLILAEGDEGYKLEAEWANRIVVVLEWAEWAGDIAFNAATTALCGPYGAAASGLVKGFMISAIRCYESGQSIEDWATENIWSVIGMVEGQIMDVDLLEKLTGGSRTKAWAIFVAYTFGKKLYQGMSLVDAALETAKEIGTQQFSSWLGQKAKASYQKHGLGGYKPGPEGPGSGAKPQDGAEPEAPPKKGGPESESPDSPGSKKGTGEEPGKAAEETPTKKPHGDDETPGKKKGDEESPGKKGGEEESPGKKDGDEEPGKKQGDEGGEEKPTKEDRDKAWEEGKQQGKQKVKDFVEAMKSGDPEAKKQAALEFLKDKNAMMELNRDPGMGRVRAEVNKTLKDMYGHVDKAVIGDLANDPYYKEKGIGPDDFRILNPTNPKKPSGTTKSSYDRDITVQRRAQAGEWIPDPNAPGGFRKCGAGETAWVDVPADKLEGHYSKRFYEAANGKPAPDASTATQFTKDHDQTCTDRQSNDSYGRYNKDLKTAMGRPGTKFTDPTQVGQAMGYKAHEWFEKADHARGSDPAKAEGFMAEGMRQTSKQWDNQALKRVEALKNQGVDVRVPSKLNEAMGELKKVEAGQQSPAQAEAKLKQLGFDSPHQVAYESGKYVESLDKLRPKTPPKVK